VTREPTPDRPAAAATAAPLAISTHPTRTSVLIGMPVMGSAGDAVACGSPITAGVYVAVAVCP